MVPAALGLASFWKLNFDANLLVQPPLELPIDILEQLIAFQAQKI